jgi:hypothetical protein
MKHLLLLFSLFWGFKSLSPSADYSIYAIRYADSPGDSLADLMVGGPKDQKLDTVYAMWLIRGGGHNILFDSSHQSAPSEGLLLRNISATEGYYGRRR